MSLQKSQAAFKNSLLGAAEKLPSRARPTPQGGAPQPINLTLEKRKHPNARPTLPAPPPAPVVHSQPANGGLVGHHILTQVRHALAYLKEKEVPLTEKQISGYLSIPLTPDLHSILANHERVHYNDAAKTYEFIPLHGIRSPTALLSFLQAQTTAAGVSVKELKDGWAGALAAVDELERSGDILVTRTKKDNQARMVWINDKTLMSGEGGVGIDKEFKDIWMSLKVPNLMELPGELEKMGIKPSSIDPSTIKREINKGNKNRKRASNRRAKVSNTHMSGILKDSKDLRK